MHVFFDKIKQNRESWYGTYGNLVRFNALVDILQSFWRQSSHSSGAKTVSKTTGATATPEDVTVKGRQ